MIVVVDYNKPRMKKTCRTLDIQLLVSIRLPPPDARAIVLGLHGGAPGNAILPNGVLPTANREIGVPGFQPRVRKSTSEFSLN
jgi:hypothetical protein